MKLVTMPMTIAEYCQQLDGGQISINKEYQRTDQVWPPAARSNLIETILLGYPIPKILLSQKTDLRKRITHKEIVDGQQRTRAIREFFHGQFRITRGEFKGLTFSKLDPEVQQEFIEYNLSFDIFNSASDEEIREVFRRINSYHVPLNPAEQRHAEFQGEFKWGIRSLAQKLTNSFVVAGVLKERQVSRMLDLELLTDLADLVIHGVRTGTPTSRRQLYEDYEEKFPQLNKVTKLIDKGMQTFLALKAIHGTALAQRENFLSFMGAVFWLMDPKTEIDLGQRVSRRLIVKGEDIEANLLVLNDVLERDTVPEEYSEFRIAASEATNTDGNRRRRIRWFVRALTKKGEFKLPREEAEASEE